MDTQPPVDILENLRALFRALAGSILTIFPSLVLILGITLLAIIGLLLLLLSGTNLSP